MTDNEPETCHICTPTMADDLPLCREHWNDWLDAFVFGGEDPPCRAHLIGAPA